MCPTGWHGPRGCAGPGGTAITCPQCHATKQAWYAQPRRDQHYVEPQLFAYHERWNSHYCQDCNIWVECSPCQGQDCTETCYYFGRPEYPPSHDA